MYDDFDEYEDYDFEDIGLYEHKRSDKVRWTISFLLIFVLLAGMIGAWVMLLKPENEAPQQEEEVIEEESGTAEVRSVALAMKAAAAANGGVSKELTATVYPSDARNKAVDWTLEWLDTEKQDVLSEYLTLVPSSDGVNTAIQVFPYYTIKPHGIQEFLRFSANLPSAALQLFFCSPARHTRPRPSTRTYPKE